MDVQSLGAGAHRFGPFAGERPLYRGIWLVGLSPRCLDFINWCALNKAGLLPLGGGPLLRVGLNA